MIKLVTSDMPEFCINYYIKGFEQCDFQTNEIEIKGNDYFSKLIINQNGKRCYATMYFKSNVYNTGDDEGKWKEQGKNLIRKLAMLLIEKGFSVPYLCIEQGDASFPPNIVGNKASMSFSFKIKGNVSKKRESISERIVLTDEEDIAEGHKKILVAMQIADPIWRFSTLYELLLDKYGSQYKVKKAIEEKYAEKYEITCTNRNKSGTKYGEKNEFQDDFSYLRNICAHLNPKTDDFQKYENECKMRIESHTYKLIQVLFEEYGYADTI